MHPYYHAVIKVKEQEFDSNSSKIIEATNIPVVQSMMTGTDFLNKSTAHIEERATVGDMVDQSLISFWHLARC